MGPWDQPDEARADWERRIGRRVVGRVPSCRGGGNR